MITQTVTVTERNTQNIIIGRRGTYNTEEIVFDLAPLISQFGDGTAVLLVKRSADASAYPAVTERNGSNLVWTISDTDTYYKGHGKCELYWYVDGGLAKTAIWSLTVLRDLGETTEAPPDPYETWVDTLVDLGAETLENAQAAEQSASDANGYKYEAYGYARGAAESQYYAEQARNQAQTARQGAEAARNEAWEISSHYPTIIDGYWAVWHDGQYWKTSYKAEGVDGRGITNVTGVKSSTSGLVDTYTLTVTYTDGDKDTITFTVTNGRDGTDGTDGVSPGVTIETITGGHRVTITDKDHLTGQSFDVMDGEVSAADLKAVADSKAPVIIDTASGAIASFFDGADNMPVKSLVCEINPVQEGTGDPSPDNVRPITGFTGVTISQANKNLFPMPSPVNGLGTNTMTLTGEVTLLPGTYTVYVSRSDTNNDSVWAIRMSQNGGSYARMGSNLSATALLASRAFTLTETTVCKYQFYSSDSLPTTTQYGVTVVKSGETATEFIPHQGETTPVSWQTEAGTVYVGNINPVTGVLTVPVDDADMGDLAYTRIESSGVYIFRNAVGANPVTDNTQHGLTSIYPFAGTRFIAAMPDKSWMIDANGRFIVRDDSYSDVATFKAAMAGQTLVYELATPVTYQLDPVTVSTLRGENNIWHDANGDTTVDYCADTKLYIDKKLAALVAALS